MDKIAHKIGTEVYDRDPNCWYNGRVGRVKAVAHFDDVIVYTVEIPLTKKSVVSVALRHENVERK